MSTEDSILENRERARERERERVEILLTNSRLLIIETQRISKVNI
jgi:hypothetical protein